MSRGDWCEVCHWNRATDVHTDAEGVVWYSCRGCLGRLEVEKAETLKARERTAKAREAEKRGQSALGW